MIGYEYGNARLRAMRARLLKRAQLMRLYAARNLDRMLGGLAETAFGPDVEAAMPRASGLRRLDAVLRDNLARTLAAVTSFYEGPAAEQVALLVDRWALHDIRTLIRLPDMPDVPYLSDLLVPAGRLDGPALAELVKLPDLRSRVELTIAWGLPSPSTARKVLPALAAFERTGVRSVLEHAYAEAFGTHLDEVLGASQTGAAHVLRTEIDVTNFLTALRLREARHSSEPGPADEYSPYIPGGTRDAGAWESLMSEDDLEQLAEKATAGWMPGWRDEVFDWRRHGDLTILAEGLRRRLAAAATGLLATGDPLGFDVPVAFTFAKEAEVRDLRLIGRALVHNLDEADVLDRLESAA